MPHWRTLGATSLVLAAIGCVPLPHHPHEASAAGCRVGTAWSTAYARLRILGTLAPGEIQVLRYQLSVRPRRGRPCGSLVLTKDLALQRGAGPLHIVEIRDFYTHGKLVANHRAFIGHEIATSGVYEARVTLPIPGPAPPGRYEVVSLLYARWGLGSPTLIARAKARFTVAP
ncbi:hypothetical protein [Acidiferrobacter sp.]|uniref:hypothetical protein n=1 Tax=Acidiferrobacter sp. TaxID=1872107 RepID=UPI002630C90B|nr:hypothetical protein [Acidiferrobacter sp.]